ncbi:hypothetical protein BJV74DRAFT_851765 [Russula compacta]|nr:hypothetical protein BJV74DRAFT_851765 [Russula compacta]
MKNMLCSQLASFVVVSTLLGSATATFEILSPGGPNLWWVAQSQNTIVWSCNDSPPAQTYQLLVNNTNPAILTAPEAIVANVPNADCSMSITTQQAAFTPSTGYSVILADNLNQTHIYAVSQTFEIKALGAAYPPSSATPSDSPAASTSGGSSGSGSGSSSSSGSKPTSSSTPKSNGAFATFKVPAAGLLAAIGAAVGML